MIFKFHDKNTRFFAPSIKIVVFLTVNLKKTLNHEARTQNCKKQRVFIVNLFAASFFQFLGSQSRFLDLKKSKGFAENAFFQRVHCFRGGMPGMRPE